MNTKVHKSTCGTRTSFSVIGIHPSSMTSGTNLLAGSNVSGRAIEYKRYEANSPTLTDKVRDAPADYPDAISNVEKVTVSPKTTQGLWVTVHVPKKTPPGLYSGSLRIETSDGDITLPLSVRVLDLEIPDPVDGFANAPMFGLLYEPGDVFETEFGIAKYSPQWWTSLRLLADNAIKNRTNWAYIVWYGLLLDGGTTVDELGIVQFDWSMFDAYVQFWLDAGMQGIFSEGVAYMNGGDVYVMTIERDGSGNTILKERIAGSTAAIAFLNNTFRRSGRTWKPRAGSASFICRLPTRRWRPIAPSGCRLHTLSRRTSKSWTPSTSLRVSMSMQD